MFAETVTKTALNKIQTQDTADTVYLKFCSQLIKTQLKSQ